MYTAKKPKIEIESQECITGTHQCGPCAFNTTCQLSTQLSCNEPSPSDWNEPSLADTYRQLRFD